MNRLRISPGIKIAAAAAVSAAVIASAFRLGLAGAADHAASDLLYQGPYPMSGKIVLLQIDQKAVEEIGPYAQWGRGVIADVIDALNQSEDSRPAVIGLDILYSGETDRAEGAKTGPDAAEASGTAGGDARLAEAAGRYKNVVAASAAVFGTVLEPDGNGDYRLRQSGIQSYEGPYRALAESAAVGHINVMLDSDGILRHHMLSFTLPNGGQVPSFALAAAQMYADAAGDTLKLPETDSRGFWYIPYSMRPGGYSENLSVADVLSGRADPSYFKNKIVLIGPYAPAFQDSCFTSMDHAAPMYGVEVQANVIEALLRGEYPREVPDDIQTAALFVVSFAVFFLFRKRRVATATAAALLVSGGWIAVCRLAFSSGLILHILWVPAAVVLLYVGCLAYNYVSSKLEALRVRKMFSRYVAPDIVDEILAEGADSLQLGGKLTEIAVLFVDIRGFTTMSEALDPQTVVGILNRYLELVSNAVKHNGGTLDKFIGDAAMAFWGAPVACGDPVMKAARAALEMAEGSERLDRELMKKYGRTVSFGIGIHVGPAVVGNIGAPDRMDYTAIGDTVNTASRLESNAPAGTVYISRAVADALEGRIRTRSLGDSVKLKGKEEGFEILVLEGLI